MVGPRPFGARGYAERKGLSLGEGDTQSGFKETPEMRRGSPLEVGQ